MNMKCWIIIKKFFFSFFFLQIYANHIVVQRWIFSSDVIKKIRLTIITSCVIQCATTDKCVAVGFLNWPSDTQNDQCVLVKKLRKKKKKNGTGMSLFALVDGNLHIEEDMKDGLVEQKKCVDVNGGYSSWSSFTACTKSCGSGIQYRNRSCDQPAPRFGGRNCLLLGASSEVRQCNPHPCPVYKLGGSSCWSACGGRGGLCPSVCGPGGYCCGQNVPTDCPSHINKINPNGRHACVIHVE